MKLIIDVDEKLVCEGFEHHFTEEEKDILIRAIGHGTSVTEKVYTEEQVKDLVELNKKLSEARPRGSWIYIGQHNGLKVVECTNCHKRQYGCLKYCGNCGADMRCVKQSSK